MLSNVSGSLNGNSSSVNLWVFSIQQTFEMGDALTWMNKRRKQEKHVIKQCKIHNMKSQGARWSFCTPTHCQTDKIETEYYPEYIANECDPSLLKHKCLFPDWKSKR